jgi:putative two-component system response regulator
MSDRLSPPSVPAPAQQILLVEDDPQIAALLEHLLVNDGHWVVTARNGREALAHVAVAPPDLILTDLDMPYVNGFEVCRQIKSDPATRLLPVLIITGRDAREARMQSWEIGADDFLTKPFDTLEVLARCRSLLRVKRLTDELDSAKSVLFAFARAVEAKSPHTWGHSERVTGYAMSLAKRIGLGEAECDVLRMGAMVHDIGKINIPDAILNKPGSLTDEEYSTVKQHPLQGVRIVEPLRSLREVIPIVRWHHERLDGRGYPDGLFGGSIPLLARIVSVADVFDALSSRRPYRPAMPHEHCLDLLQNSAADGGLDPELVNVFCDMHPSFQLQSASSLNSEFGVRSSE